jgi:hypothetical protein
MLGDIATIVTISGAKVTKITQTSDLETVSIGAYAMNEPFFRNHHGSKH